MWVWYLTAWEQDEYYLARKTRKIIHIWSPKKVVFWLVALLALPWHPNNPLMTLITLFQEDSLARHSAAWEEKRINYGHWAVLIQSFMTPLFYGWEGSSSGKIVIMQKDQYFLKPDEEVKFIDGRTWSPLKWSLMISLEFCTMYIKK